MPWQEVLVVLLLLYTIGTMLVVTFRDLSAWWSRRRSLARIRRRLNARLPSLISASAAHSRLRPLLLEWDRRPLSLKRPRRRWNLRQLSLLFRQKHPYLQLPHRTQLQLRSLASGRAATVASVTVQRDATPVIAPAWEAVMEGRRVKIVERVTGRLLRTAPIEAIGSVEYVRLEAHEALAPGELIDMTFRRRRGTND